MQCIITEGKQTRLLRHPSPASADPCFTAIQIIGEGITVQLTLFIAADHTGELIQSIESIGSL